jgi:hypothetical protein
LEHISVTLTQGQSADPELGASRVVAAANEVIGKRGFTVVEAQATVFRSGRVTVKVNHSAIGALINQEQVAMVEEINELLKRRYGGPAITNIDFRVK